MVRNIAAFESRYGAGLPVAGQFEPDNLSNGGENVKLSFGAGAAIREFQYLDAAPWPLAADGSGRSLVLIEPGSAPDHSDPANWRASARVGGSPGAAEPGATLASWKGDNFTPAELADPGFTGNDLDLDLDGMNMILEYALVADPKVFDTEKLPTLVVVDDGGVGYLGLRYRRRADAGDLTYEIESSTDLVNWTAEAGVILVGTIDNGDESVTDTARLAVAVGASDRRFLRLKVSVN